MKSLRPFFIFLFIFSFSFAFTQEGLKRSEYDLTPAKGIIYFKEIAFNVDLKSNGFGIGFYKGNISKYYLTKYYHFSANYFKDDKSRSMSRYLQGFTGISNYVFGKQNDLFMINLGMGRKYFLSEKSHKRGVAVGYSFEGGLNLGLLKPYYLVLEYADELERTFRSEAYSEENAYLFLDDHKIRDKGSFYSGWDELSLVPGAYAKIAAHFSLGAYGKYVKALEVGLHSDLFIRKVPVMIETESLSNKFIFPSFFINFQLGKRSR